MLQAIAGWDRQDPTSIDAPVPDYMSEVGRSIRDLRIGIDRRYALDGTDSEVASALEAAVEVFTELGARFVDVTFPPCEPLVASWNTMCAVETALAHESTYPSKSEFYGPALKGSSKPGARRSVSRSRATICGVPNSRKLWRPCSERSIAC